MNAIESNATPSNAAGSNTGESSITSWPQLPGEIPAAFQDELHVVRISLDSGRFSASADWSDLSADEIARADRYVVEPPRRRFRLCRRAVRRCLGWATGQEPSSLEFGAERNGKPTLRTPADTGLVFNVSHTGDWGVIALGWRRERGRQQPGLDQLGVDIETIDPRLDTAALADRFFSRDEQRELNALPPDDQTAAFYRLWTSKEAYMKALGLGMLLPLGSFTMCANPHWPPRLIGGDVREGPWQLAAFSISDSVPGVLMWSGDRLPVRCWSAPPEW